MIFSQLPQITLFSYLRTLCPVLLCMHINSFLFTLSCTYHMCYVCHEIYALKVTFYHCHDDEEKCKFKRDLRLTEIWPIEPTVVFYMEFSKKKVRHTFLKATYYGQIQCVLKYPLGLIALFSHFSLMHQLPI